jgi:uncharacterized membrane protein (DUF373 family)
MAGTVVNSGAETTVIPQEDCRRKDMLNILKKYEKLMIQALMVMMAVVLGLATIDLAWIIIKDIVEPPFLILSVAQLLEIFGLFMLVVIGIELLETIMKTYLTQGQPHFEVVLSVAIIAIARKVIILDLKEMDSMSLIGIASIVVALTTGYFLMKKGQAQDRPTSLE